LLPLTFRFKFLTVIDGFAYCLSFLFAMTLSDSKSKMLIFLCLKLNPYADTGVLILRSSVFDRIRTLIEKITISNCLYFV